MFGTWRLSLEPRIEHHEPIRIEGGRQRRALIKSGVVWTNVRDRDKDALDRRLGFLSLAAAGGQPAKGIAAYDEFAVLRGLSAIRLLASKPAIELKLFSVRCGSSTANSRWRLAEHDHDRSATEHLHHDGPAADARLL